MIVGIIQARMESTRLPGKIFKTLAGKPVLWHVVERCKRAQSLDRIVVATTTNPPDDVVEEWGHREGWNVFRGSSTDVLDRYQAAAAHFGADVVVRITADCPLLDPRVVDACVQKFETGLYDYVNNRIPGTRVFPKGLDVEVFSCAVLDQAHHQARSAYDREHVTTFLRENRGGSFRIGAVEGEDQYLRPYRLTLDYPEDYYFLQTFYQQFYEPGAIVDTVAVLRFLDQHPEFVRTEE